MNPYYILIADDDPKIRSGIHKILEKNFQGTLCIYEAENGIEALRIVQSQPIHILVTDVKMPFLSGIDLVYHIRKKNSACQCIILSGYDDFTFVRDALRYGAVDYLLKPIHIPEFIELIQRTLLLLKQNHTLPPTIKKHDPVQAQQIIEQIYRNPNWISEAGTEFILPEQSVATAFIVLKNRYFSSLKKFEDLVYTACREYDCLILSGEISTSFIACLFSEHSVAEVAHVLAEKLKELGLQCGRTGDDLTLPSLHNSLHKAKKSMESFYYDLAPSPGKCYAEDRIPEHIQQLISEILTCDQVKVSATLDQLLHTFSLLRIEKYRIQEMLSDIFYELMNRDNAFIGIIGKYKLTEFDAITAISNAVGLQELQETLTSILCVYLDEFALVVETRSNDLVVRAKRYIEAHYESNLQLADVAEYVHLNPTYFSQLFKKATGETFRDYLRKVKISHAQELLRNSDLKIYQIALHIGYTDTAHFTRAFRQVTGLSPNEFRNQLDSVLSTN